MRTVNYNENTFARVFPRHLRIEAGYVHYNFSPQYISEKFIEILILKLSCLNMKRKELFKHIVMGKSVFIKLTPHVHNILT
jgi:hypothetical protein